MTTDLHPPAALQGRPSRRLSPRSVAVALSAAAMAAAGCGSSSKSSSSAGSTASSTPASVTSPATSSPSSPSSQPLTKAQYENKLGPLLNDVVDPALRATLGTGGLRDPQKVAAAITSVKLAHDQMAAVTPPTAVADLNQRAVAVMSTIIRDMTRLRAAETSNDRSTALATLTVLKRDALRLEALGNQFTSRGY